MKLEKNVVENGVVAEIARVGADRVVSEHFLCQFSGDIVWGSCRHDVSSLVYGDWFGARQRCVSALFNHPKPAMRCLVGTSQKIVHLPHERRN